MKTLTFKQDLKNFWTFIQSPTLGSRFPGRRGDGWWSDFKIHTPWGLIFKWLFFLWGMSIFILAPIVLGVSDLLGATNRLHDIDISRLVLLAAVWAPLVEELLFRFGLRRPRLALLYVPILTYVLYTKAGLFNIIVVVLLLALFVILDLSRLTTDRYALPFKWRRLYCRFFPVIFHGSVLVFASMHLMNYEFPGGAASLLLPLLILPQWLTGLVIAWMRVRDGFACAVVMHALFNGLPVVLLALLSDLAK